MDEEFRRKNRAQFDRARRALQYLGAEFIRLVSEDLVVETPGFGNQYMPPDRNAQYVPTGRLRGGWNYTRSPIKTTSKGYDSPRHEAGPFSHYGHETVARIISQLKADRMGGISYLENDVAYGNDIVRGENNHAHIGPRNFPKTVSQRQHTFAREALQNLKGFR